MTATSFMGPRTSRPSHVHHLGHRRACMSGHGGRRVLPTARHVCREFGSQFLEGRQRGHAASNTRASAVSAVAKAVAGARPLRRAFGTLSRAWHRTCVSLEAEGTAMAPSITLLDLVNAVAEHARSEAEVIATIVCMVNQGRVRLCGTFKGARFDLTASLRPERG